MVAKPVYQFNRRQCVKGSVEQKNEEMRRKAGKKTDVPLAL